MTQTGRSCQVLLSGTVEAVFNKWILANWWSPFPITGWPHVTDSKSVNPVKLKVWNALVPSGVVTVKDSVTVPPPTFVPVKVTVGAGSKAKLRARSIESNEKG